jgi:hypothetical protein
MIRDRQFWVLLSFVVFMAAPLFPQPVMVNGNVRDVWSLVAVDSARIKIVNVANPFEQYITYSDASGNWSQSIITGVGGSIVLPDAVTLHQNYPNPNCLMKGAFRLLRGHTT